MTLTMRDHYRRKSVLTEIASLGLCRTDAAKTLRVSQSAFDAMTRIYEVPFNRAAPAGLRSEFANRNAEIANLFDSGETLEAIGKRFGLTRERVRQIARRLNMETRSSLAAARRKGVADAVRARNLSTKEAAAEFGYSESAIIQICRSFKVTPRAKTPLYKSDMINALADRVRAGESIHAVSEGIRGIESLVRRNCNDAGIEMKYGRWRDFSGREAIIRALRKQRIEWNAIAEAVANLEGVKVLPQAVKAWATRHMEQEMTAPLPRQRRQRVPKSARTPKPKSERVFNLDLPVIEAETAKAAALINYGRCSASKIGAAHGVSRNVIIGHWNRLRAKGLLPPINHEPRSVA